MPEMNPRVVQGGWEALMVSARDDPFVILDFWRIDPTGQFYYIRALEDDLRQESHTLKPGSMLDFYLVVYRVTEVVSSVVQFARELGATSENKIIFAFRWRKLRGRALGSWSDRRRILRQRAEAHDDEVTSTLETPGDVPDSAIPSHVYRVVRPLFLAFQGYDLPQEVIEGISADVLAKRA